MANFNYFNTLNLREKLAQLGCCELMDRSEFADGCNFLKGKKVVIIGCGAQGLNQGLNLRDSGLDVSYALRQEAIDSKRASWKRATENGFKVGTYAELIPTADLVINLTPDKQHEAVVNAVQPLMKAGACLGYSHGFNMVELGMQVRKDLAVCMVAPKSPGTEVREEYKRGFGVPTLIAVHPENDPNGDAWDYAKAWAAGTGGHRAGCLRSSFVAEVKSDLMGEQTILCGVLQAATVLCYDHAVALGADPAYTCKLLQYGWETICEALKQGGITNMIESSQSGVAFTSSEGNNPESFGMILRHEAGGHAFAFLDDEYFNIQTEPTADHIAHRKSMYEKYGWYANIDFTNDPKKVKWSAFLTDERYKDEVGIFEGGSLYARNAYRPTNHSMMNDHFEYFNAPSRWAIYKRIMELSGEEASFEKFLEYDAINRGKKQANSAPRTRSDIKIEHTPPVIIP